MRSKVFFADEKLQKAFDKLKVSKTEDRKIVEWLNKAFYDLEKDAFCSIAIPKRLIPKVYIRKYGIDNLWKYNLPRGWRLLYSVTKEGVEIISIILEWMNHKEYERRFGY